MGVKFHEIPANGRPLSLPKCANNIIIPKNCFFFFFIFVVFVMVVLGLDVFVVVIFVVVVGIFVIIH